MYCGKKCQKEDWNRHKAWHAGMKILLAEATPAEEAKGITDLEPYGALLKKGLHACAMGNTSDGAACFQEAIRLCPDQPVAYANIGFMLRDAGDFVAAVPQLLKAVELYDEDTEPWAVTSAVAWFAYANPGCESLTVPSWMTVAAERAKMGERCALVAPNSMQVWAMLGMSLAEQDEDLSRAAQAMMRAAKLTDLAPTREGYLKFAKALLQKMQENGNQSATSSSK